jgi:hypothetical protein
VIEKAYGHLVPSSARQDIHEATHLYASLASVISKGVRVEDVRTRIGNIRKSAKKLRDLLTGRSDEAQLVQYLVDGGDTDQIIGRFIVLTDICERRLQQLRPHFENEAWDEWVRRLTKICDEHGLPTPVRKDSDKQYGKSKPSPFIALVRELQGRLPQICQRHLRNAAMAQAIYRARAKSVHSSEGNVD